MAEKHKSTVCSNDLLGLRFVLSVVSLTVSIKNPGRRNEDRNGEERRGICMTEEEVTGRQDQF